jgi:hypothetical protein
MTTMTLGPAIVRAKRRLRTRETNSRVRDVMKVGPRPILAAGRWALAPEGSGRWSLGNWRGMPPRSIPAPSLMLGRNRRNNDGFEPAGAGTCHHGQPYR